jgi:hypothetical protein
VQARHVRQFEVAGGQQARAQDRKGGVLGAGDGDVTVEALAADNLELVNGYP